MLSRGLLRFVLWLSLGAWFGSWAFFAFVVSRVAFQVLPGDIAGDLAGSLLTTLHFGGVVAGLLAAATAAALGRKGWLVVVPLGLALICMFSELWITPEIAAVRPSATGPASTEESANRFRLLHQASIGLFLAVHAVVVGLIARHAWLDADEAGPEG